MRVKSTVSPEEAKALGSIVDQVRAQIEKQIKEWMKDGLSREEAERLFANTKGGERYYIWSHPCQYCDKKIGSDTEEGFTAKWKEHEKTCKSREKILSIQKRFTPEEIRNIKTIFHLGDAQKELGALVRKWKKSGIDSNEFESMLDSVLEEIDEKENE